MKRAFLAAALAALALSAHAAPPTENWFGHGLAWWEHPCGLEAFGKYGQVDTPEVRRAYELTLKNPALCSKLFPVEGPVTSSGSVAQP